MVIMLRHKEWADSVVVGDKKRGDDSYKNSRESIFGAR